MNDSDVPWKRRVRSAWFAVSFLLMALRAVRIWFIDVASISAINCVSWSVVFCMPLLVVPLLVSVDLSCSLRLLPHECLVCSNP